MASTYEEALRTGGGRIEYVFHVAGYPWAIATSPGLRPLLDDPLITNLPHNGAPNLFTSRQMFGVAQSGGTYLADYVVLTHGMNPPSEQTIKLSPSQGAIETGAWSVTVPHTEYGLTLAHRPAFPVRGLDGLHNIPDTRDDVTISYGTLSRSIHTDAETTIYVYDDHGLADLFAANDLAGLPTFVWIGHECMLVTDTDTVDDETSLDVVRGVWRSRAQSHFLDDHDGAPLLVASQPLGGVVGRPCVLWGVLLSADGTTLLDVVRAREGRIGTGVKSVAGLTTIDCDGWTDWLRTPLQTKSFDAPLRGYLLSRPSAAADPAGDHMGHIAILEYTGLGALSGWLKIWMCAAGTSVYYETLEELIQAVNAELAACFLGISPLGNPNLANIYWIDQGDGCLYRCDMTALNPDTGWQAGLLPWALALGKPYAETAATVIEVAHGKYTDVISETWVDPTGSTPLAYQCTHALGIRDYTTGNYPYTTGGVVPEFIVLAPFDLQAIKASSGWPPYIVDFAWEIDAEVNNGIYGYEQKRRWWAVADHPATGQPDLFINNDYDAEFFDDDSIARFGRGAKDSVALVDTSGDNYLRLSAVGDFSSPESGQAAIIVRNFETGYFNDAEPICFWFGSPLCYQPFMSPADPYVATLSPEAVMISGSTYPCNLFSALLGNTHADAYCPSRFTLDFIPDVAYSLDAESGIAADQWPTIAWSQLLAVWARITADENYRLAIPEDTEGTTFAAVLEGFLLGHGISPTWYYDASWRFWRMGFRVLGGMNASEASLFGREFDISNISSGDVTIEHVHDNLTNRVEYSANFDGESFAVKINTDAQSAYASTGGRKATVTIKDYVTHHASPSVIANSEQIQREFRTFFANSILSQVATPHGTATFDLTPATGVILGCGVVATITDDSLYDPMSGEFGLTDRAALITEFRQHLYGKTNKATMRFGRRVYGYVPSLSIHEGNSARTGNDTIEITTHTDYADNEWQTTAWIMTDLAYFDCYRIVGGAVVSKNCSCGDYNCVLIQRYAQPQNTTVVYRNVVISDVDLAAGTATLTAAGLGDDWLAEGYDDYEWILIFEMWDQNLEPCQKSYLYHADENDMLVDGAAVETPGRCWG